MTWRNRRSRRLHATIAIAGVTFALVTAALLAREQDVIRVLNANPNDAANRPMPKGTGALTGQVRDAVSNAPVPGAVVTLVLAPDGWVSAHPVRMLADAEGRFALPDLPAGSFLLSAKKPGFADGAWGRLRPGGSSLPLDLADGERLSDTVLLWPLGAIAGTVVDDIGEPAVGATVRTFRRSFEGGRARLTEGPSDATDDRGNFRIAGLEAGSYIVGLPMTSHAWPAALEQHMLLGGEWPQDVASSSAGQIMSLIGTGLRVGGDDAVVGQVSDRMLPGRPSAGGHMAAYLAQFYSGASSAIDATTIALGPGEQRSGVGLALRIDRTWNVSGAVTGLESEVDNLVLRLSPAGAAAIDTAVAVTDARGRFTFLSVPSGSYVIRALRVPRGEPSPGETVIRLIDMPGLSRPSAERPLSTGSLLWAEQPVVVDGADVVAGPVTLRAGAKMRGRITFDGTKVKPAPDTFERIRITLNAADERTAGLLPNAIRGRGERDALFATVGAPSGRYIAGVTGLPDGWSLGGVMLGARDLSIEPFDLGTTDLMGVTIVLTDRPASIAGRVSLPSGALDTQASIIVFPVEPTARVDRSPSPRQLRSVRPDRNGAFVVPALPPGHYLVAAVSEAQVGDWQDPKFLEALARSATRVDLAAGESRQTLLQTVKVDVR